jgi:hypothetical protein
MAAVEVQVRLQAWEQEAGVVLVEADCLNQELLASLEEVVQTVQVVQVVQMVQTVQLVQVVQMVEEEPLGEGVAVVAVVLDLLHVHKCFR